MVQGVHQAPPRGLDLGQPPRLPQELRQVGPAEEGHAEQAEPRGLIFVNRVDGNDVGVLQSRQHPGLVALRGRQLQGHEAVPQAQLLRQEDPRERSSAKLQDEAKPRNLVTDPWQANWTCWSPAVSGGAPEVFGGRTRLGELELGVGPRESAERGSHRGTGRLRHSGHDRMVEHGRADRKRILRGRSPR